MAEVNCCPDCGCEMPPDSPAGLCPDCLLGAGLAASDPFAAGQLATEATPGAGFTPPKPEDLADRFPQFEILDLLGYGGMGAVYQARQKSLDRLVALKIIKPGAAGDPGFAERFEREAKALAKLNHPNIVSVHDSGESDGLYYFVMEHVDGTNLRHLIESKELLPEQAIKIIPQICEALQYAHDEGIVHRDIKPENILVDSRARVKIADFGLAKLLGNTALNDHTLTGTHQVMGTPRYMAPEQMEGSKAVDHRADIYSLGVVFYEMLTGELPMGSFEPPSRKAPVDGRLDQVVLRSLAKEPERRYQHASDVRTDVEAIKSPILSAVRAVDGPYSPVAGSSQPARFSGKAIIGACWVPLFFICLAFFAVLPLMLLWDSYGGERPPWPLWLYAVASAIAVIGLAGLAAPFGTTILGFVAMNDIRHSHGRLCGLGLAFFDVLFFPLLVADALLGVCIFQISRAVLPAADSSLHLLALAFLVILPTNVALIVWCWRRVSGSGRQPLASDEPPTDWSPLVYGLVLVVPLMALMAFGMRMTGSAWVLAALALPWLCLGIGGVSTEGKPTQKAMTWLSVACFLFSLGLIALGIQIEQSGWPLAGLAVGLAAAFIGILLEEMSKDETKAAQNGEAVAQAAEQLKAARALRAEMNDAAADDEEEDPPEETLQWTAWWIGAVGAFRCWQLLSNSFWSSLFESFSLGEFGALSELVLGLTGPVILIAAAGIYHARFYWFGVTACILCTLSGSCPAVIIGVWSLVTLFDTKIRALFVDEAGQPGSLTDSTPAKPLTPYGYGEAIGSTLTQAFTHWWRERDSLFTRAVQALLLVLHIVCLFAFLGFRANGTPTTPWHYQFQHEIGFPSPWFTIEHVGGPDASFSHDFHWSSSAWIVAALGFAIYYVYCRIERVRNPAAGYWYKPEAFLLVWGALALASIGLGLGLEQLATRLSPGVDVAADIGTNVPVTDQTEAAKPAVSKHQLATQRSMETQIKELMEVASKGRIGRIREMMSEGADVNDKDAAGQTPLMRAAANGHVSTCLSLIVMGANPNEKDQSGVTALMHAAEAGQADVIRAFAQIDQAAQAARDSDASPEEAAAKFKQTAGVNVQILEEYGARAINLNIDPDTQDGQGETALMKAAAQGDWRCIAALQAGPAGFQTDGSLPDDLGRTALMHLAVQGHTDCVGKLIAAHDWGDSDEEVSYRCNRLLDPELLSVTDHEGKNAIELATENGHEELAELLREEMRRCLREGPAVYKEHAQRALGTTRE